MEQVAVCTQSPIIPPYASGVWVALNVPLKWWNVLLENSLIIRLYISWLQDEKVRTYVFKPACLISINLSQCCFLSQRMNRLGSRSSGSQGRPISECLKGESVHYSNLRFMENNAVFILVAENWTSSLSSQRYLRVDWTWSRYSNPSLGGDSAVRGIWPAVTGYFMPVQLWVLGSHFCQ